MKLVMVITKMTGEEENDRQRAAEYCRFAVHKGVLPLSPYLSFHGIFQEELGAAAEHLLVRQLAKRVDEIWVFASEEDQGHKPRLLEACREYGEKVKFFDVREIAEQMLICAMYPEELIERLEEMEDAQRE